MFHNNISSLGICNESPVLQGTVRDCLDQAWGQIHHEVYAGKCSSWVKERCGALMTAAHGCGQRESERERKAQGTQVTHVPECHAVSPCDTILNQGAQAPPDESADKKERLLPYWG